MSRGVWTRAALLTDSRKVVWCRQAGKKEWEVQDYDTGESRMIPDRIFQEQYVLAAYAPLAIRKKLDNLFPYEQWETARRVEEQRKKPRKR